MITTISSSNPIANKSHDCMASEFIRNYGINGFGYSFSELRAIAQAKRNNYKIVKGQAYIKQVNKFDGEVYTFKAIPEMHQICLAHNLYEV